MSLFEQETRENQMNNIKRGFSSKEAANYLGISESTLRQSRMDGTRENRLPPPPFIKAGKKILYLRDALDRWLESYQTISKNY